MGQRNTGYGSPNDEAEADLKRQSIARELSCDGVENEHDMNLKTRFVRPRIAELKKEFFPSVVMSYPFAELYLQRTIVWNEMHPQRLAVWSN